MILHLANISYRLGRTVYFDEATYSCTGDAEANALLSGNTGRHSRCRKSLKRKAGRVRSIVSNGTRFAAGPPSTDPP